MSDEHAIDDDLRADAESGSADGDTGYEIDLVEVEVEVVPVEVVEVDAETAYAARDAAQVAHAADDEQQDESLDAALDQVDEGATQVRESHSGNENGELPLLIPGHDRFARLEAVPVTGDARVDAATARLDELADLPTADHVAVYDDVHHRLQDALADADPT